MTTWKVRHVLTEVDDKIFKLKILQSKIVDQRNANDESEIDESMLHAGLLTYPILQAADILAYK